eukprot:404863-Prymnesium_polylepis.2
MEAHMETGSDAMIDCSSTPPVESHNGPAYRSAMRACEQAGVRVRVNLQRSKQSHPRMSLACNAGLSWRYSMKERSFASLSRKSAAGRRCFRPSIFRVSADATVGASHLLVGDWTQVAVPNGKDGGESPVEGLILRAREGESEKDSYCVRGRVSQKKSGDHVMAQGGESRGG